MYLKMEKIVNQNQCQLRVYLGQTHAIVGFWTSLNKLCCSLLSEIKFFTVEDLCRFWHLWTDFNYANVPSIYTFLSRNIYYILLYYCLPHFGLTYIIYIGIYQSCFWLLSQGSEEIYNLHLYFFSLTLDAFVTWCYLSNLTTKNASWNLLFSRCVCPTVRL